MSWEGVKVRNTKTNATGVVKTEFAGFGYVGLSLALTSGASHYMELCSIETDRFTKDWEWYTGQHEAEGKWIPFTAKRINEITNPP